MSDDTMHTDVSISDGEQPAPTTNEKPLEFPQNFGAIVHMLRTVGHSGGATHKGSGFLTSTGVVIQRRAKQQD